MSANGALLSDDGTYRYTLWRRWGDEPARPVLWIMLNPSTADAAKDDQTIRKCRGFSERWGHNALMVVNLFALRSRDPKALLTAADPTGPDNRTHIVGAIALADLIVLAWGGFTSGGRLKRINVEQLIRRTGKVPHCLGKTANGQPRHPVMLGYNTPLEVFS